MKIYTKTGDLGQTQVYRRDIERKDKDDVLLETYGELDELNSRIGFLLALINREHPHYDDNLGAQLKDIQQCIFTVGFALSDSGELAAHEVEKLEVAIDQMTNELAPLTAFILPGGTVCAAQAHLCRTQTRKAERQLVSCQRQHQLNRHMLAWINRLSDYFFTLARYLNESSLK